MFVCMCLSRPSAVFVDYKAMRISREKTEQTDYTAALVQPKALRCSPESLDRLIRGDSVWRNVLCPGWLKSPPCLLKIQELLYPLR